MILKTFFLFFATLATGVRFNLPKKTLAVSATVAALSYAVVGWLQVHGATIVEATFVGAFLVAMSSEILARHLRVPAMVVSVPGIIPLVPGSVAYRAVSHLVDGQEVLGVGVGTRAAVTAAAIASGLLLASSLSRKFLKGSFLVPK